MQEMIDRAARVSGLALAVAVAVGMSLGLLRCGPPPGRAEGVPAVIEVPAPAGVRCFVRPAEGGALACVGVPR
jgi:hypothetical protein